MRIQASTLKRWPTQVTCKTSSCHRHPHHAGGQASVSFQLSFLFHILLRGLHKKGAERCARRSGIWGWHEGITLLERMFIVVGSIDCILLCVGGSKWTKLQVIPMVEAENSTPRGGWWDGLEDDGPLEAIFAGMRRGMYSRQVRFTRNCEDYRRQNSHHFSLSYFRSN